MRFCLACESSLRNTNHDRREPDWVCTSIRCVQSIHHRDARCPVCGARPDEVIYVYTLICENGHRFVKHVGGPTSVN
jgi:hypothetical protein